ncbi:hypothetical protein BRC81_02210 [Halobacteriales archaeon QS_1_68_20]|nr:MAG: hypothetical protein BRC81_02210 [Halobacteriales archaeon QS_1_68_20]
MRDRIARVDTWFAELRADPTRRRVALAVGAVLGLAAATVHWLGLVAGGALVGLTRRSLPRALLAGLGFGVLVVVAFVATAGIDAVDVLAPLSYLTVGLALVAPAWGALVRGVV